MPTSHVDVIGAAWRHVNWLTTSHPTFTEAQTLFWPWLIQFIFSWIGFSIYIVWDYNEYKLRRLEQAKLPTRHPVHEQQSDSLKFMGVEWSPFVYNQLFMVPVVLYNQLVVWPLVSLLLVWPQWAQNHRPPSAWTTPELVLTFITCMLVSDQMWYWSHRLMHVPWCWKVLHKMHHIAPQCAISATYVHCWEYTLFTISMQLPFALAGFPMWIHAVPLAWGMLTGSGAHSGYSGSFAAGDQHNAHHFYHNVNFGLLMIADGAWGTLWKPGDPPPPRWSEAEKIWDEYKAVHGSEEASTFTSAGKGGGKTKAL